MPFDIDLIAAKQAIALPDFKSDDLLTTALTNPASLNYPGILKTERERRERDYRRLAFLGDALFDSVLADYLFRANKNLTRKDLDDWRQKIASKESFTEFAIALGLPEFCSTRNSETHQPPRQEPRLWAEMFEAVVAVVFLDQNRDFLKLAKWLNNRFIAHAVEDCLRQQG